MEALNAQALNGLNLSLSLSQREVWLDQRAWPHSTHLNIGGGAFLQGPIDVPLLRVALAVLVAQTDALRLVPQLDGSQQLLVAIEAQLELVDVSGAADARQAMRDWWSRRIGEPFVWHQSPPWRFALLRANDDLHGLTIQFHHLIMDGWGTTIVMQRWSEIYNQLQSGKVPEAVAAPSYQAFIDESNAYRQSAVFERDGEYWLGQVPSLQPPLLERRHVVARPAELPASRFGLLALERCGYAQLHQSAVERGSSAFNYFLAALVLYYARTDHRQTVVVGVPSLNRGGRRFRATPGMFVGVLPVSVTVTPGMTVGDLLVVVGAAMRGALRHPRYPLSELGRSLEVLRHGRDGLFDVLLSFERQDYAVSFGSAQLVESRQLFSGHSRYPLGVTVCEFHPEHDLELVLDGSSARFDEGELEPLALRLWQLVQRMAQLPDALVESLPLLHAPERELLLHGLHQHLICHPDSVPFITQFEQQVARTAHATALVWDGGNLSYGELDHQANQLAHRLRLLGAGKDRVVALAMARCADMVVALIAVAKSGAAFLPLDPDAPLARLTGIVEESGAVALVIEAHNLERLSPLHAHPVVPGWNEALPSLPSLHPPGAPAPGDLAYVLFTSGSTGRPKGVTIEHGALARRLAWLSRIYGVVSSDRSAQATQVTFDPSLIELCLPLIHGASVALPPPGRLPPEAMGEFALRHGVTIMAFVPSTLSRFLDTAGRQPQLRLRVACCGGEVLSAELVNRFLGETRARLFNVYGPTETCIFATAWACEPQPPGTVLPIGKPVDDTRIYVLDARLEPMPPGAAGEIFIGGGALARGYLNHPDLSADVFLKDPFVPGSRMYRTGDRGWLDADGQLHFVGRMDRQIKLRGYRIELGEIEAALLAVEGVTEAAASLVQRQGKPSLHAWVATASGHGPDSLQRVLRTRLPDYMIPGGIQVVSALPTSGAGKIDYAALLVQDEDVVSASVRPPNCRMERELLALWEEVLERRPLHVQDNFFDMGGDSLAAVSILAGIETMTSSKVPLYLLTEHPTVELLSIALGGSREVPGIMVSFNAGSTRVPLYLAASGHGDLLRFQNLARALQSSYDVRMLQPPMGQPIEGVAHLAHLYADTIESQGGGPACLAGFSVGGIAALETARLLRQRGVAVGSLVLIDTIYPRALWGGTLFWRLFGWLVKKLQLQELSMNGRRLGAMFNDAGLVGQVLSMAGYRPVRFDGHALLIKTSGLARWHFLLFRPWRRVMADDFSERQIAGLHGSIFEAGRVAELAAVLDQTLALPDK